MKRLLTISLIIFTVLSSYTGCQIKKEDSGTEKNVATLGTIERLDPEIDKVIPPGNGIEILANGFEWSEGPVWIPDGKYLLFSDIPPNRVYKWSEQDSIQLYLEPSGFTGQADRGGEEGSNGLILNPDGKLVLCQHGDRRLAVMDASLSNPAPEYTTLVDNFEGKRLNSPNDAVYGSDGSLYFTDPPYGLEQGEEDPAKELDFQGVFKLSTDGELTLLTPELSRPNGIGLSPDETILYVANSDPEKAIWMAYEISLDGKLNNGKVFYDATDQVNKEPGLPDGLAVHSKGYIFATGPGGVWIFAPDGRHLGTVKTTQATANCTFNDDESVLYITADMYLLRVRLKG